MSDITVVVPAYKIPFDRILSWYAANNKIFVDKNLKAIIITENILSYCPDWCTNIVYPEEQKIFSISKTKNYGIRSVGHGIIITCDIDIIFSEEFIDVCYDLKENQALFPTYYAVRSFSSRDMTNPWPRPKGVNAAHYSAFERIHGYNEKMVAYGSEDGDLFNRFVYAGFEVLTQKHIWHVAHDGKTVVFEYRSDQWNRDSGFNPYNCDNNRKLLLTTNWTIEEESKNWGLINPQR